MLSRAHWVKRFSEPLQKRFRSAKHVRYQPPFGGRSDSEEWAVPVGDEGVDAWVAAALVATGHRDLSASALGALLEDLSLHPMLMARAAALAPATGHRSWVCLHCDEHVDVWVIAWTDGADTGWHDHDSSSGALRVLAGAVTEDRLGPVAEHVRRTVVEEASLYFEADHIHRITVAGGPAVTIHAYSPPLRSMRPYRPEDLGALRRRATARPRGVLSS